MQPRTATVLTIFDGLDPGEATRHLDDWQTDADIKILPPDPPGQ